jgi:hypothetical protein
VFSSPLSCPTTPILKSAYIVLHVCTHLSTALSQPFFLERSVVPPARRQSHFYILLFIFPPFPSVVKISFLTVVLFLLFLRFIFLFLLFADCSLCLLLIFLLFLSSLSLPSKSNFPLIYLSFLVSFLLFLFILSLDISLVSVFLFSFLFYAADPEFLPVLTSPFTTVPSLFRSVYSFHFSC